MSAKEEYRRQRQQYRAEQDVREAKKRVHEAFEYLAPRDPSRAYGLLLTNQQQWASEYRDHEIPMKPSVPGTSNHLRNEVKVQEESPMNTNLPVTFDDAEAHIIHTFAPTHGNLEIIRQACHKVEGWSKIGEGYMLNAKTNNNVHWIEIKSPKGKIFRVAFDVHPKHKTPMPHVWRNIDGKLYKKNLYDGSGGAAMRYLREKFTTAGPKSPYFSLHGAHPIVVIALLLNGVKLNIVTHSEKNLEVTQKILCS